MHGSTYPWGSQRSCALNHWGFPLGLHFNHHNLEGLSHNSPLPISQHQHLIMLVTGLYLALGTISTITVKVKALKCSKSPYICSFPLHLCSGFISNYPSLVSGLLTKHKNCSWSMSLALLISMQGIDLFFSPRALELLLLLPVLARLYR